MRSVCAPSRGHTLLIVRIASVEMASALGRKAREGALSVVEIARVWRLFRDHLRRQYEIVAVTDAVCGRAEQLLFAHPLRAYDAVQVGAALDAAAATSRANLEFWTADRRQAQVAAAEGLTVRLVG